MNASFARDEHPIDESCDCYTCRTFTRAYLRHLIVAKELLAGTLISIHNLRALIRLMEQIRTYIADGSFESKGTGIVETMVKQREAIGSWMMDHGGVAWL